MSSPDRNRRFHWLAGVALLAVAVLPAAPALARSHGHRSASRTLEQQAKASPTVAMARCYGRFIGWRDQLKGLMQATGSYTPSPDAPGRFDHVEASFADTARSERKLTLHLRPNFAEKDFPRDLRTAFRKGLKETTQLYAASAYKTQQAGVTARSDLTPIPKMTALEANADGAFKPLAAPCEALADEHP
jgi:hypothetical protein